MNEPTNNLVYADRFGLCSKTLCLMKLTEINAYFVMEGREYSERDINDPETAPKTVPITIQTDYLPVEMTFGVAGLPCPVVNCHFVARVWMPVEYTVTNYVGKKAILADLFPQLKTFI